MKCRCCQAPLLFEGLRGLSAKLCDPCRRWWPKRMRYSEAKLAKRRTAMLTSRAYTERGI